ncbi:hypothetical protein [Sphingosinicella sp. BN140058]|uniref:hypothetical protein n=1 Tax=Sphingosinicella sp. BN140058 TaxID=1892855 RepID=UPI0010125E4D|nr:hypothetical protein [Sphingosinicella sp. BN140058]QAY77965.1 hypothetical protein ETR14_16615 [Sphingosinicella sp. BN140058]
MAAKLVFLVGVMGLGGYVYHKASNYDPNVFAYSKSQVEDMLVTARTTIPRRDGDGKIQIWGTGRSAKGVSLAMQYSSTAPVLSCEAVITEIDPKQSRVVPDCGHQAGGDSAIGRTQDQLRVPMFEEHILATLNKRDFDRSRAQQKETAVVLGNMGGMQREALKRSDETQRMIAESKP